MNRRSFFRGLCAAALTAVAQHYMPRAPVVPDVPVKTIIEQMLAALERLPKLRGRCYFIPHPDYVRALQAMPEPLRTQMLTGNFA